MQAAWRGGSTWTWGLGSPAGRPCFRLTCAGPVAAINTGATIPMFIRRANAGRDSRVSDLPPRVRVPARRRSCRVPGDWAKTDYSPPSPCTRKWRAVLLLSSPRVGPQATRARVSSAPAHQGRDTWLLNATVVLTLVLKRRRARTLVAFPKPKFMGERKQSTQTDKAQQRRAVPYFRPPPPPSSSSPAPLHPPPGGAESARRRGADEMAAWCPAGLVAVAAALFASIAMPASFAAAAHAQPPAPPPTSDGTSIDQGIAYMLMLIALVLTYLIHPLDASSPYKLF
ncbi:unnamed protein product [Urochloa humidicola]